MISQKEISNKEIVEEVYRLIDENWDLNAFVTLNKDSSIKKAEDLDNNPSDSSLAGIPIAQKDLFCTKGIRTTCGSKILDNFIPPYSATVIENLENAGCISVGKTNMDEFAMGSSNETSYFGSVHNPWGDKLVPGGSSGGSASAVAAGTAKVVAPIPNNLVYPIAWKGFTIVPSASSIVSFISLRPRLTILVPVLAISAGNDTKLPIGNFLKPFTKSDT